MSLESVVSLESLVSLGSLVCLGVCQLFTKEEEEDTPASPDLLY